MVLGVIFIYAGTVKLLEPEVFAELISAYGIVPQIFLGPVSILLPLFEVAAGAGVMLNIRGSLAGVVLLLLLFLAVLGYGIHMGLDVDCGCFAPGDPESEAFHGLRQAFGRDIIMMAGALYIILWQKFGEKYPSKRLAEEKKI